MNAEFVSSFLRLDLNDDDDISLFDQVYQIGTVLAVTELPFEDFCNLREINHH